MLLKYKEIIKRANVLNCDIVFSEFELQSRYYVHIRTFSTAKDMNLFILATTS